MNAVISDLANLLKAKRKEEEPFVLMLGAGASISAGVKPTLIKMRSQAIHSRAPLVRPRPAIGSTATAST